MRRADRSSSGGRSARLVRSLTAMSVPAALDRLRTHHDLDPGAAENLLGYLRDQAATGGVPDDRTLVIERSRDELGEWRICLLSPLGGRIHAPWSMAAGRRIRQRTGLELESMWTDDGFVMRFPETDEPPDPALLVPDPAEVEELVLGELGMTSLFAAKFREAAARALLLPRRRPGGRTPLWQQRKRAADLLAVASRFGSFPILLETYRECLRDVFDMPALVATLQQIRDREIRILTIDLERPSPFASSLLFGYVANFLYDGDAPLAERRAQALSIDQAQLRQLIGEAELRELLDADIVDEVALQRRQLAPRARARSADGLHDLLLRVGDLTRDEIERRVEGLDPARAIEALVRDRRAVEITIGGEVRIIPVEYASRYRDALGVPLPSGLPESLLAPSPDAGVDLARRFARTNGPFTTADFSARYGLDVLSAESLLKDLLGRGQLVHGEFRSGSTGPEWCDPEVLQIDPSPIAREAATPGRAGRSSGARPARHDMAGRRQAAPRAGCAARRHRNAAGGVDPRIAPRARGSARAHRRLSTGRAGHARVGGRSRVGWRRFPRRARRPCRAVSDRRAAKAAAASGESRGIREIRGQSGRAGAGDPRVADGSRRVVLRRDS